jgi:hypothetical protein
VQLNIDSRKDFSNEEHDASRSKTRHGNGKIFSNEEIESITTNTLTRLHMSLKLLLNGVCNTCAKKANVSERPVFMEFIFDNTKCSGIL